MVTSGAATLAGCSTGFEPEPYSPDTHYTAYLSQGSLSSPIDSNLVLGIARPSRPTDEKPLSGLSELVNSKVLWKPPNVSYGDIERAITTKEAIALEGVFDQDAVSQRLRKNGWYDEGADQEYDLLSYRSYVVGVTDGVVLVAQSGSLSQDKQKIKELIEKQGTTSPTGRPSDQFETMMDALSTDLCMRVLYDPRPDRGYHRASHSDPEQWDAAFEPVIAAGQAVTRAGDKVDCLTTFLVENNPDAHANAIRANIIDQAGWASIAYHDPSVSTVGSRIEVTERRSASEVYWSN